MVAIPGGVFVPTIAPLFPASGSFYNRGNYGLLDADEEEFQLIGRVYLQAGSGSKTFGTSGSKLGWAGGSAGTFVSSATLRTGVKKASSVDLANGPPTRATIGAAAFDVYKDLIGGTDTLNTVAWNESTMDTGTPFTVAHGDLLAVCFHLNVVSGTQSINFSAQNNNSVDIHCPASTLVTAGPAYAFQGCVPNIIITFDDGTIGWLDGSFVSSGNASTTTVGNGNIFGNVFQLPFDCQVDAILAQVGSSTTTNFDIGFWSDPAGTPTAMPGGTVSYDAQLTGSAGNRWMTCPLSSPITLSADTAYFAGIKQNSATAVVVTHADVNAAADLRVMGLDENTYAALSTSGGAIAAANSGKRRAAVYARISAVDIPAGSGGLLTHPGMSGGMRG